MPENAYHVKEDASGETTNSVVPLFITLFQSLKGYQNCCQQTNPDHGQGAIEGQEEDGMAWIVPWNILRQHAGDAAFELNT
jgi:hypothetical protein